MTFDGLRGAWRPSALAGFGALAAMIGALALTGGCQSVRGPRAKGPIIVAPAVCVDFTFPIYFESQSAAVTREAGNLIAAAAQRAKGCAVTGIVVVGLADARGSAGANLALSKRRAEAVTRALHGRGFNNVAFQVAAAGNSGARTVVGEARPLQRRADVQVHLAPEPPRPIR